MIEDCLTQFVPLTLSDQEHINGFLKLTDYRLSRYNFLNLWMYSKWIPIYYRQHDDILLLSSYYHGHYFAYMPLCRKEKLEQAFSLIEEHFSTCALPMIYACFEDEYTDYILKNHPSFEKKAYRDSSDYLYEVARFRTFGGKKLQKKRNHLNAFYGLYPDYQYQEISPENIEQVKDFVSKWYNRKTAEFLDYDQEANYEVLNNYFALDCQGACIIIDKQVRGFIIATRQHGDTVQINIEKGDEEHRGIYQALLKEFLNRNYPEAIYMNREDDLGLENLRKAKLSYYPDLIIDNYRVCEKDLHVDYEK